MTNVTQNIKYPQALVCCALKFDVTKSLNRLLPAVKARQYDWVKVYPASNLEF